MASRLFRNSSWQLLALAAPVAAEFVTAYQITDALGLDAYGLLSFVYAFGLLFHLSPDYVRHRLAEHAAGHRSDRLFIGSLLSFEWWLRHFL